MSLILCMSLLTGCGNVAYTFPYDVNSSVSSFNVLAGTGAGRAEPFAADLCVVTENQTGDGSVDMSQASAAVLFDVNNKKVLYSKNAHERLYPASLTKVMTALVALQNASPDTVLTATDSVKITESGAQLCGLKAGDTMTLDQALHILLMYSANDAAMLIAENIGDFIAVLDPKGRRIYNSPSYIQFFGSKRDLRGSDSFTEIHPDDRERVRNAFNDTVKTGRGRQLEYRMVINDGSVRIMESRGNVIRDHEGKVTRVVVVSHDITERKHMENQVRQMAFHDALTQLPNRRLLSDRLNQTMAASARSGYYGALMFLDLDNFKPLNDQHGHDVGDLLLIEVAERLKNCVREMDTVARFGGDEFVVMISELSLGKAESLAEAGIIAEKIRHRLGEPYWLTVKRRGRKDDTVEHRCTATIGVALFVNHDANPDKILKCADAAMYRAKESGRNRVCFADLKLDDMS